MTTRRKIALLLEFFGLFVLPPLLYVSGALPIKVIPALWILTVICLCILGRGGDFDFSRLWKTRSLARTLRWALVPFLIAVPFLVGLTFLLSPDRFFDFVRDRPLVWAMLMLLYPILSVYPQGIVYRTFIFHRYRKLFPTAWSRILVSALAFSLVHVIFMNWVAPVLTLGGGLLFAWTYERTRSPLVVAFQHALFGCFLFTIGLGRFIYSGGG